MTFGVRLPRDATRLVTITTLLLSVTCFAARFDALVGTVQLLNDRGSAIESIRIERFQQKYLLYRARHGQWQAPVEIAPISKPELEGIIKQRVDVDFEAW